MPKLSIALYSVRLLWLIWRRRKHGDAETLVEKPQIQWLRCEKFSIGSSCKSCFIVENNVFHSWFVYQRVNSLVFTHLFSLLHISFNIWWTFSSFLEVSFVSILFSIWFIWYQVLRSISTLDVSFLHQFWSLVMGTLSYVTFEHSCLIH